MSSKKSVGPAELSEDKKTKKYTVYSRPFEVDARYDVLKIVGYGSYGQVCSAMDTKKKEKVAIKKMAKVFDDLIDAKRILREIKLLRTLSHDNILCLKALLRARDVTNFTDLYMVTDLMDADLNHIVRSKQPLLDSHCQYFLCQLLRGLEYLHAADILHRDLKPSNLLVNANCDLKICDFGLARHFQSNVDLTGYVVTRWYRAPELLLMSSRYTKGVDIWSVGCILAELLARKPLVSGNDYLHQLHLVIKLLGTPPPEAMAEMTDQARRYVESMPHFEPLQLAKLLPQANPLALDLMGKMLQFRVADRISAKDALDHPYLEKVHRKPIQAVPAKELDDDLDENMTEAQLRKFFVSEMNNEIEEAQVPPPPPPEEKESDKKEKDTAQPKKEEKKEKEAEAA